MARRSRHRLLLLLLRYLVVALGYHKAYGSSAPKGHQVVTAIEYQEVILACKYAKKTMSSRLEWKKLGRSVSFVYYQQSLQGDFKYRAEMIDFSIRIKNVTRNDAGKYRCEISAPSTKGQNLEEDTVTLEVLVAPAVPLCNVPSSALSGTVVELRCHDKEGNPAPEYTWFKDGVNLLENPRRGPQSSNSSYTMNTKSGTLQFNTVSKVDSGEYFCEAHNSVGRRRCHAKRMQVDDLNIRGIIAAVVGVAFVISVCGLGVCYAQRKGYFSKETSFQRSNSASKATTMSENTKQIPGFTGPTNGTWIPHRVTGKMSVVRLCLAPHSSVALDASHQTPCNISYKGPDSGYFKPYWFYGACYNYSTPPW